jgi:hypothetical protein
MAEFKFGCPSCGQGIICDDLWTGHAIQCPSCQAEVNVPANPGTPASKPTGPVAVPAGGTRLSINPSYHTTQGPPKTAPVVRNLAPPPPKKKSPVLTIGVPFIILCGLGVGGYYGYNYYVQWKDKKAKEAEAAAAPPAPPPEAAAAQPAPPKELPAIPPVWTLDVASAKIPEGKANGSISGTNFVVDSARIDKTAQTPILRLRQGSNTVADREILIYLHLNPAENPTGRTWTVSQDMHGATVPTIMKLWKVDPRYAPRSKSFSSGYAMKLELGQMTDNMVDGKIFLALPDPEQSVVGGVFKAAMGTAADMAGQPAAAPVAAPVDPRAADFRKRYGVGPGR